MPAGHAFGRLPPPFGASVKPLRYAPFAFWRSNQVKQIDGSIGYELELLRGRLKQAITGILALVIFGLVSVAFLVSGWKAGAAALVGTFVLANLFGPLALLAARRMIAYPDLGAQSYQQDQLGKLMKDFGTPEYFERREKEKKREQQHRSRTVSSAMRRPEVRAALEKHGSSQRDIEALYDRVEVVALPPQLRERVLPNAALLD